MKELQYPFDNLYILKKRKAIKRFLTEKDSAEMRLKTKIAVLGGSTTNDIIEVLELFLLDYGIEPVFYESEYGQYWEDVMFDNPDLMNFHPDIIFIHTTSRNIIKYPSIEDSEAFVDKLFNDEIQRYKEMWDKLDNKYQCIIIQNNFELPFYRLLGNADVFNIHGRVNFIMRLNMAISQYAQIHEKFYINDINYLAACYGVQKWADPFYWHMYKYALAVPAIPELTYNLTQIIKSIYGKNKKAIVLDLDNTLWGGLIGEDGIDNIEIGEETSLGQVYKEFQTYLKECKKLGIMLCVNSKNDYDKAISGLRRPENVLRLEDFLIIKANWNSKDINISEIAEELNIGYDSLVFVDDNPAERHIVALQNEGVSVPEIEGPETYISTIDRSGFFELTTFSTEDLGRSEMYKANIDRKRQETYFASYKDYLADLQMNAEIRPFNIMYLARIAQLTNKSNQFNLTSKRYSQAEIEKIANSPDYITLYGKLEDKFGDNGIVSVIIGHLMNDEVHIELWLMSCRVLKRNMELAMMDQLVWECKKRDVKKIIGYYLPTTKNGIVKEFYEVIGFQKKLERVDKSILWEFVLEDNYVKKNLVINVEG